MTTSVIPAIRWDSRCRMDTELRNLNHAVEMGSTRLRHVVFGVSPNTSNFTEGRVTRGRKMKNENSLIEFDLETTAAPLPSPIRCERVAEGRVRVHLPCHHRPATFIYAPRT